MSNDLLFPILPRNTKVPVEVDERVKKVQKTKKTEHVSEDDHDQLPDIKRTEIVESTNNNTKEKNKDQDNDKGFLKNIDVDV